MKRFLPLNSALSENHRALALQLLRRHHQLARSEIADRTGISEATVSRIVGKLLRHKLVSEAGAARSTGGRPAAHLRFNEDHHYSAGIDIHPWDTKVCVGTLSGRLGEPGWFVNSNGPMAVLAATVEKVRALAAHRPEMELAGVGVTVRGLVNTREGVVERGISRDWMRIPVRQYLENELEVPVYVENNVRAAALAEYHYGNPDVQDAHCLLLVTVDEGIGFSMVIDGKLYYGQHMAAGEFGQMVIADAGGTGTHDRPGSLESLASDSATCARYYASDGGRKTPAETAPSCVRTIAHRALAGDRRAVEALQITARYLGIGISNAIWGLDPDAVVVDGTIADAWHIISPVLHNQFADGREFSNFRDLILRPSALRGEAAMIGAAALPFQSLFSPSGPF